MTTDAFDSPGQVAILATAFVTLVTTLATLLYQFVREGRRHDWEIEAARRHVETAKKSEEERASLAVRVDGAETKLNAKIDENTAISKAAFVESNHMNEKLVAQAAAFDKLLAVVLSATDRRDAIADDRNAASDKRSVAAETAIKAVKSTVDTTAGQVSDIHHTVVEGNGGNGG